MSIKLLALRKKIDEVDGRILALLAERMGLVDQVGKEKRKIGKSFLDEARWSEVLVSKKRRGKELGLKEEFVAGVYELIHEYALEIEREGS